MKMKNILCIIGLFYGTTAFAQVQFIDGGWPEALAKAKRENKYIFVDAYTDWCYWCKVMDQKTFPLKETGKFINEKFIPVKIDMEKNFGVNIAMKYRVTSFPTFLVFNSNGRFVYRMSGFQTADQLRSALTVAQKPSLKEGFKGISEKIELDFPKFYVQSFKGNETGKVIQAEDVDVTKYLESQKDLFSEVNWSVLTKFLGTQKKYHRFVIDNKTKLTTLYGEAEVTKAIETIINSLFTEAVEQKNEGKLNEGIGLIDQFIEQDREKMKYMYQIRYCQQTDQWIKMDKLLQEGINKFGFESLNINYYAWAVYEKCTVPAVIKDAINWMKIVVEKNPSYPELDTYAALLYKDKQFALAEKYATIAIEEGKKVNEDVKETEALLVKIKAGGTMK